MKSYFKFLSRNKAYTLINVAGLVVSLMFIILIGDYTWRQYSIDSWHSDADRTYIAGSESSFFMWPQAAREIEAMCPEVEQTCCVMSQNGSISYGEMKVKEGEHENGIIMLADSNFFSFFDFELTAGDRRTALDAPDKCVITERLARRLFGEKNPIGESLRIVGAQAIFISNDNPYDSTLVYTVSAVAKDFDRTVLPNETQVIAHMDRFPQVMGYTLTNKVFAHSSTGTCKAFLRLRDGLTLDDKKQTIEDYLTKNYWLWDRGEEKNFTLTPLTDIMFAPQNEGYGLLKGDKTRLRILLAAVLALLFFAVSNYINLTVANTGFRAKEMATRRLFGSSQHEISLKLIAESTVMVAVAFVIGFLLAVGFQKDAAELFKGKIALTDDLNVCTVSVCLGFILLVGIISGIMPSYQISRFQPIDIVKGNFRYHSKLVLGRLFIIVQNVVTVVMLTAALVIWLQLKHLIEAPLGFNTENLWCVISPDGQSETLRAELEKLPNVEAIGACKGTSFASYTAQMMYISKAGEDKRHVLYFTRLDTVAFNLYGLEKVKDHGFVNDGFYLTKEALRRLEITEEDRELEYGNSGKKLNIAGVLRDFHRINVLHDYEPLAISLEDGMTEPDYLVKVRDNKRARAELQAIIKGLPDVDDNMDWYVQHIDESIANTFEDQQNTLKIITLFTIIAVIISVMGYVGMSLFFIRQRKKEIGIRKIMGSTSGEVMVLMLRIFCSPLLLSFVIAVPLSWYIMHDWLTNFSYRITLSPWIFIATCAFALLVAFLSVGFQIINAVRTNPVESIKTE